MWIISWWSGVDTAAPRGLWLDFGYRWGLGSQRHGGFSQAAQCLYINSYHLQISVETLRWTVRSYVFSSQWGATVCSSPSLFWSPWEVTSTSCCSAVLMSNQTQTDSKPDRITQITRLLLQRHMCSWVHVVGNTASRDQNLTRLEVFILPEGLKLHDDVWFHSSQHRSR